MPRFLGAYTRNFFQFSPLSTACIIILEQGNNYTENFTSSLAVHI